MRCGFVSIKKKKKKRQCHKFDQKIVTSYDKQSFALEVFGMVATNLNSAYHWKKKKKQETAQGSLRC